jgi:hypothetical protein
MALTIVLMCIAFAVLLIIAYMIYNDYQVQQEIDKKLLISKQREVINETEDILLNVTQIPFSSKLVTILQNRILNALKQILSATPNSPVIRQRITDISEQIKVSLSNPAPEPPFSPPKDTTLAIRMIKVLRRLRKIIRIEFNRGRISQQDLLKEDRRLTSMIFKIQFSNLLRNIEECEMQKQYGTMDQLVISGLRSLKELASDDPWFKNVEDVLKEHRGFLSQQLADKHKQDAESDAAREKEHDEMDKIFGPKKKW